MRGGPEHAEGTEVKPVTYRQGLESGIEQYPGPEGPRGYGFQPVSKPVDMAEVVGRGRTSGPYLNRDDHPVAPARGPS